MAVVRRRRVDPGSLSAGVETFARWRTTRLACREPGGPPVSRSARASGPGPLGADQLRWYPAPPGSSPLASSRLSHSPRARASKSPWDILLLFGGAFALADAFRTTGLAVWAGNEFARHSAHQPAWVLITAVCLILVFMTEFTTNVAAVNAVLSILATASVGLGIDPRLLMIPATISASCGFMLPIGTPPNAIVFGTGKVSASQMAKYGLAMNWVGVLLTALATLLLLAPQQGIESGKVSAWATGGERS